MKAAVFREVNVPMEIEEVTVSKPGPREVLIRTQAAGICHSDMHFFNGSYPGKLPMVLGRSLNQVKGLREQIAVSRDTIRETLVGSKFEILKEESKAAVVRAKALHAMNHAEWKAKIRHRDLKVEVELGESQLYAVVKRLKEEIGKQRSTDVQGAVKKWWQNI